MFKLPKEFKKRDLVLVIFVSLLVVFSVGFLILNQIKPKTSLPNKTWDLNDQTATTNTAAQTSDDNPPNGSYSPTPSIPANEDYVKYSETFKTYKSNLGFSFKYPPYLTVEYYPKVYPDRADRIVIKPKGSDGMSDGAIMISDVENYQNITPSEWLLGPDSGYSTSTYGNYYREKIDGQDAVYTDGGMWSVVNTPDNTHRLSIADLPAKNGDRLFTEMGIIVDDSFTFNP